MRKLLRIICLLLALSLIMPRSVNAQTKEDTRASAYIAAHAVSIHKTGNYQFKIWFDVTANAAVMDEIGISEVIIYRSPDNVSWYEVRTYTMDENPEMIATNTTNHMGYITYSNATGKYYKAAVTVYARQGTGTAEIYRETTVLQMR